MRDMLVLALLSGLSDAWLPNRRLGACAKTVLGLMLVRRVCQLVLSVFAFLM